MSHLCMLVRLYLANQTSGHEWLMMTIVQVFGGGRQHGSLRSILGTTAGKDINEGGWKEFMK